MNICFLTITISLSDSIDRDNQINDNNIEENTNINQNLQTIQNSIDEDFPLPKGLTLKEKQVFGGKGTGKRITKKVKSLLEKFFLNGNLNPRDKLTAQKMHEELMKYVESNEIEKQNVPKVSTIQGWISRYAAAFKEQTTEAALRREKDNNEKDMIINSDEKLCESQLNECIELLQFKEFKSHLLYK
ncbi:hypothetical protein Glove_315g46 [Diversispora epigaea]|uniref:Uncharacterized protein n=1 Tax=Diversispora epigaea TaxID=1348612 RepID=A0A397HQI0_9GLOM|nr:hypothetical protein Glove_315g46 [Diversispora epigaea]